MSTFEQQKQFFKMYGFGIKYQRTGMLYWYYSNPIQPDLQTIKSEIMRRGQLLGRNLSNHDRRKTYRNNALKVLLPQINSVAARTEIWLLDLEAGIGGGDSMSTSPISLKLIERIVARQPRVPRSKCMVQVGDLLH